MLGEIANSNNIILGSGIWFEPNVFDANEEYVGPYVYKDGDQLSVTYDYSNAEYDYFSQEYYTLAKGSKSAIITDPYYDETTDLVMSSCTMPIFDGAQFIGCVTVDMELTSIQDIANSITVGKTGHAILLNSTGGYLAGVEDEKINEGLLISEDTNPSLAAAGNTILGNESGITSYKSTDGSKQNVYYCTISETGWHLLITIPNKELYSNVTYMSMILFIIAAVALILSILIVTLSIGSISKGIKEVDSFSSSLAEGDFTIAPLKIKTKDELGSMGNSLNNMYSN